VNCPQHTEEQRQSLRRKLLGNQAHGTGGVLFIAASDEVVLLFSADRPLDLPLSSHKRKRDRAESPPDDDSDAVSSNHHHSPSDSPPAAMATWGPSKRRKNKAGKRTKRSNHGSSGSSGVTTTSSRPFSTMF
jgi:hypothetical protein